MSDVGFPGVGWLVLSVAQIHPDKVKGVVSPWGHYILVAEPNRVLMRSFARVMEMGP